MTVDDWIREFEREGFALITHRGRCRQLAHPWKAGRITVAGLRREEVGPWIERSMRSAAARPEHEASDGDPARNGASVGPAGEEP